MVGRTAGAELLSGLNALTHVGVVGNFSDAQLLDRFLARGGEPAEAAFEALVTRHGPMVLDICRKIVRNRHEAEDAFQATFLVLASKAGSIRQREALAGWLLGVARRVAVRLKAERASRRSHEARAAEIRIAVVDGRGETWPELHEEIDRLPDRYREPVVLCYLQGLSTEATALRLGCPRGTVLSRLSRARELLRDRLDRRGLAPAILTATAESSWPAPAALAQRLIRSTVQVSLAFTRLPPPAAGVVSTTATALATGVIHSMMMSKLKALGAAALACFLMLGGIQTFGRQLAGQGGQAGVKNGIQDRQAALARSAEKLQSELDESLRINVNMRKELQSIRATLEELRTSVPPTAARDSAGEHAGAVGADSARTVSHLAEVLKGHPGQLSQDVGWGAQLYMTDLAEGGTTLLVDEPMPGGFATGYAKWTHDGSRIVFETAGGQWPRGQLMAIDLLRGHSTLTHLGEGNHPTFSPDDKRVALTLFPSAESGAAGGVWMIRTDGSDRHRVGVFGCPSWSPDGRALLINSFAEPTTPTVVNLETGAADVVRVAGHQIISWPTWAGPDTLVAVLTAKDEPDSIALLDVRSPAEAKVTEVLWKRSPELDVTPRHTTIRPGTRECYFVGAEAKRRGLYVIERDGSNRARALGVVEYLLKERPGGQQLGGLAFSPDGRYLLFHANRPELLRH
jgi:RNA polymerase sigma factor (sigma-70 family)